MIAEDPRPENANETSVFQSALSIDDKIERARTELLDLSARNRLLNVPRFSKSAKTIDIVGESTADTFRILVRDGKAMTFLAGAKGRDNPEGDEDVEEIEVALPEDDERDGDGRLIRHGDTKLQTLMTPNGLQKRLLDLYFDARTLEEEQGVNILYLAMGLLRWVDPNNAENVRHAPLILVPVSLERSTAAERFKLKVRPEDFASNLSLEAFLDRVHAIKLPEFESTDEFDPVAYVESVRAAISTKPDWSVETDGIVLGFFSFAKFLMYRDLDPKLWPADAKFTDRPLIRGLLADGFAGGEPMLSEDARVDDHIAPQQMLHIVDADSSQTMAIHEARKGRDIVIQGPPGTGKSQTIANIIAAAIADGKTVLFVAEKMAALEVVKRRLDQAGVGDACLELHSNKANKRTLLMELQRTWDLGAPRKATPESLDTRLTAARDQLNAHPARLHRRYEPYGLSPFQVMGQLTRLRQQGQAPVEIELEQAPSWTTDHASDLRRLLGELAERVLETGLPIRHPWYGVGIASISPMDLERLMQRIRSALERIPALDADISRLDRDLQREGSRNVADLRDLSQLASRVSTAPEIDDSALAHTAWENRLGEVRALIDRGEVLAGLSGALDTNFRAAAWEWPVDRLLDWYRIVPEDYSDTELAVFGDLSTLLPDLIRSAGDLQRQLGTDGPLATFGNIEKLVVTADRVAVAPDVSPEAFAAAIWERGLDQAGDLAEAVDTLSRVRAELAGKVTDAAWDTDMTSARTAIATSGKSFLKFANGDWRKANALVKSLLANPSAEPDEVVRILDTLSKGKEARRVVREGDALGRAAFGADWRGERTDPQPLEDLVSWMRSLKGVAAEARLIAGRLPDKGQLAERAAQVKNQLDRARLLYNRLWAGLGAVAREMLGNPPGVESVDLRATVPTLENMAVVNRLYASEALQLPATVEQRLQRLKSLQEGQRARQTLSAAGELGTSVFGADWKELQSDWKKLGAVTAWVTDNQDIRILAASTPDRRNVGAIADGLLNRATSVLIDVKSILASLEADPATLFDAETVDDTPLRALEERLQSWNGAEERLSQWLNYSVRSERAEVLGAALLVDRLEDGRTAPDDLVRYFDMAYYEALFRSQVAREPELGRFDGDQHFRLASEFASMDLERMKASRFDAMQAHHAKIPSSAGGIGPVGVLKAEMARRRNHMPIRQLMQRAAPAVQALKPVFMMSPLSIAQFLPPGQFVFDLVVMDEASQIQPIDAIGAVARAKQVVVVGDERQLPPTRFFSKMTAGETDEDGEEGAQVSDIESILGLFSARGLPQRMLRWHYRSRHQSLIAVSNREFYENKLFIVPSPYMAEAGMGLRFHFVENGVFEDRVNKLEAQTVAKAIIDHARTNPEQSLGVATFSLKQRREIQDNVELLRRANPDTEEFFHAHPSEPFFIKNLENVQGDERDVMLISVGYAKNKQGHMAMRFGPLGADGGERRLNVLISRAKRRCEVYASITDDDIDLERSKGKGVMAFKLFLHYARTGKLGLSERTGRDMDSVFEEQVAAALQAKGYQVHPQVGIAGFFIDLAIADSERPGRYVLGIECDGAAYHDARSARDRDRLRQAVLEDHGWIIHRVWSSDWFQRPKAELDKVIAAIEKAKVELDDREERLKAQRRAVPVEIVTVDRHDVTEVGLVDTDEPSVPAYVEAELEGMATELHETPVGALAELVRQVADAEGPVHRDEVVTRIRSAWGLMRAGGRIDAHVERAIETASAKGSVVRQGNFVSSPSRPVVVRDRSNVASPGLRRWDYLPPAEIDVGITTLVADNFGATEDEVVQTLSRQFGYKATSAQLREAIRSRIEALKSDGRLILQDHILAVAHPVTSESPPPPRG
ncbi:MAG: DUF3320 domain-containing protein [Candidatus Devosia phytovorans]|uniref:DUF3320 domain-containing protein n=1 Tax=Candidatus Devosia phytovorans TaxID=3121372 RepID=A0AAJ6B0U9_9HYPH|nr:DUF3320 domain-containing protein [Devosia sp.]WEK03878.1 MAG: DUF3320 domain-containing protein [Devosia sp.]